MDVDLYPHYFYAFSGTRSGYESVLGNYRYGSGSASKCYQWPSVLKIVEPTSLSAVQNSWKRQITTGYFFVEYSIFSRTGSRIWIQNVGDDKGGKLVGMTRAGKWWGWQGRELWGWQEWENGKDDKDGKMVGMTRTGKWWEWQALENGGYDKGWKMVEMTRAGKWWGWQGRENSGDDKGGKMVGMTREGNGGDDKGGKMVRMTRSGKWLGWQGRENG